MIQPRLTAAEFRQAKKAGYAIVPSGRKASFFGSMFAWLPSISFGSPTFWGGGANAVPPINEVRAATGVMVSQGSALTLSAVWACVWLNARTMASLPLDLKRYSAGRAGGKHETLDPLYNVLRWRPNQSMSAFIFWTAIWASEQLWGTGYAEIKRSGGKVIALDFLLPQYMTPYQTESGQLRFAYNHPLQPKDYAAKDIFRVFTRSLDGITGVSVIEFARNSFGLAQSGESAASKTFKRGLNAGGFLTKDQFLTPEQRALIRESVGEFTGDTDAAGGTMVLEGGFDYKQLSMKPLDAELLSSRQFSVEDVCRWFNVPPILIGHASDGQTMWGSGIEQIFSGWTRLSLRPFITGNTQAIRQHLIQPADMAELYAEYDLDDLLAADSVARSQLYSTLSQNGIKTRNELREKEGDGPLPGGDVLTVQSNLIPLDQLGKAAPAATPTGTPAQKLRNALLELLAIEEPPANRKDSRP